MTTEQNIVRFAVGIAAGGLWNLASLWCLTRMLRAWLGPVRSPRRAMAWLLLKLVVIYPLAVVLIRHPAGSMIGFGIGFTAVLIVAMAWFFRRAARVIPQHSHGR